MAQLTITVPDAVVPRILAAYGHIDVANPQNWIPATVPEITAQIKAFVTQQVINYEAQQALNAKRIATTTEAITW